MQQSREYAEILGLKFAYATNGHRIIEIDYTTGTEREVDRYATPDELFARLTASAQLPQNASSYLLEPSTLSPARCRATSKNCNQSGHRVHPPRQKRIRHIGNRHWQDLRRIPDLLEVVEQPLEPHR